MAPEFTKLVFKEKNLFVQWLPKGTKPKCMIFFSSEPCKQTWPIILISTDIHLDKVWKRSWYKQMKSCQNIEIRPHQIYFLFFGFCAKNVGASQAEYTSVILHPVDGTLIEYLNTCVTIFDINQKHNTHFMTR